MTKPNLKQGWSWARLGDVAEVHSRPVPDPANSGYERFVSSDCMDRFHLTVRRWRPASAVTSSKKLFRSGDYLFVGRSLYASDFRERAARVDFSGVSSNGIIAISEKPEMVADGFLAVVLNQPRIWEFVVKNATGTLTRYVYWKTLKEYEFALPPLAEQHRMLAAIQAADRVCEAHHKATKSSAALFRTALEVLLGHGASNEKGRKIQGVRYPVSWPMKALGEVARVERGKFSHRPRNLPEFFGGEYPFIQVGEIANSLGTLGPTAQFLSEEGVKYSRSFPRGTVLISITGVVLAKTAITDREVWAPDSIVGIQPSEDLDGRFLEFVLRRLHPILNGPLATLSTTQKNINLATLRPLLVPCPPLAVQREVVAIISAAQHAIVEHSKREKSARRFLEGLMRSVLSTED